MSASKSARLMGQVDGVQSSFSEPQINIQLFSGEDDEYVRAEYSMTLGGLLIVRGEMAAAAVLIPCSYVEARLVAAKLAIELEDADR